MGKRKKKTQSNRIPWKPIGSWKPLTSQKAARKITSKFHEITHKLEQERANRTEHTDILEKQLKELGGRDLYQQASVLLTDKNKSSAKFVFRTLTKLNCRPKRGETPLKTLEIGAINTQLLSCPWLDVEAIDINSRNPKIKQVDFFQHRVNSESLDVIVNAMVLNCVPTPGQRGKMLQMCHNHLKLQGFLFLVLPLRCVTESHYMNQRKLLSIASAIGFKCVEQHKSPKVAFYCLKKEAKTSKYSDKDLLKKFPLPLIREEVQGSSAFSISFDG